MSVDLGFSIVLILLTCQNSKTTDIAVKSQTCVLQEIAYI